MCKLFEYTILKNILKILLTLEKTGAIIKPYQKGKYRKHLKDNVLNKEKMEENIMTNKATIMLSTINDVKEFVSQVTLCDYDVDLISGRYAIDAKSIMGIFSLDLSKPIQLEAQTEDASEFFAKIKQFIVE